MKAITKLEENVDFETWADVPARAIVIDDDKDIFLKFGEDVAFMLDYGEMISIDFPDDYAPFSLYKGTVTLSDD